MESENELIRKLTEVDEANDITKFMKTTKEYLREMGWSKVCKYFKHYILSVYGLTDF